MPRKVAPQWGWSPTHDVDDSVERFRRLEADTIAAILGITPEGVREIIDREFNVALFAFYNDTFDPPRPSVAEMRAGLDQLKASAEVFRYRWVNLDSVTRSWLSGSIERLTSEAADELNREINALTFGADMRMVAILDELITAINTAELPPEPRNRRGRKPDFALREILAKFAEFIEELTGKGALNGFYFDAFTERYEGRFVRLAEYVLEQFAPELGYTNAAIGEQIRRTLGDRAKR